MCHVQIWVYLRELQVYCSRRIQEKINFAAEYFIYLLINNYQPQFEVWY